MQVGDLVRIHIGFENLMAVVTSVHQEFNEHGFVPEPDAFALTVFVPKNPYSGPVGPRELQVFASEVWEVMSAIR